MSHEKEREQQVRILSEVPPGSRVCMVGFARHGRRARRLAELGLNPGIEIKVLQSDSGQPIMLRVRGSQLAIDRREADHLFVSPLEPMPEQLGWRRGWQSWGRKFGISGRRRRNRRRRGRGNHSRSGVDAARSDGEGDER